MPFKRVLRTLESGKRCSEIYTPCCPLSSPPSSPFQVAQHECQSPSLRSLRGFRIEHGERICEIRLRSRNGLAAKIRKLRDLVFEHLVDGAGLEELMGGCWGGAAVEQGG